MKKILLSLTAGLLAFAFTMSPVSAQMWGSSSADTAEKPPVDTTKVEVKPAVEVAAPETTAPVATKEETPKVDESAGVVKADKDKEVQKDASGCPAAAASVEHAK